MEILERIWRDIAGADLISVGVASGLRILFIVIVAHLAIRFASAFIDRTLALKERKYKVAVDGKRAVTLAGLGKSIVRYTVDFMAVLAILEIFRIDTKSILAGAGIIGLAVGFGAQNLVKDIITGFFIILENQFTVGEYVEVGQVSGIVEEIGLRVTKFRDFSGALHLVPNGTISTSTNWSRGNVRALVQIDVGYEENLGTVLEVLERVAKQMQSEVKAIRKGPKVLGLGSLGESSMGVLLFAETEPMAQWSVEREMRLRVKQAFDAEGIKAPYPRRVLVSEDLARATSSQRTGE